MVRDHFAAVQPTAQPEPRVLTATFSSCATPGCGKWACTDGFCRNCPKEAAKIVSPRAKPKAEDAPEVVVSQCVCAPLRAAKLEWEGWPQAERDECLLCLPADRMKQLTTARSNEGGDPDDGLVWHDTSSTYECACGAQYSEVQHLSGTIGEELEVETSEWTCTKAGSADGAAKLAKSARSREATTRAAERQRAGQKINRDCSFAGAFLAKTFGFEVHKVKEDPGPSPLP